MDVVTLAGVLDEHRTWLRGDEGGERADLSGADLSSADLSGANLRSANLSSANLRSANLSSAKGLLDPVEYLTRFQQNVEGVIVYKAFGVHYPSPATWKIKPGSVITEVVNPDRTIDCGCGVNVAGLDWIISKVGNVPIWRCLIRWIDLASVVVPYHTDGKIRCGRVTLLEQLPTVVQ